MSEITTITGNIEDILYQNSENGYAVFIVRPESGGLPITVTGTVAGIRQNSRCTIDGVWKNHSKHGLQLAIEVFRELMPESSKGIEAYLASGIITGIGRKIAASIVKRFGAETLDVFNNSPEKLLEIRGISAKKLEKILSSYRESIYIQESMIFLQQNDIKGVLAHRIIKQYKQDTISKVEENPYRLCTDFFGVGFITADRLALSIGFPVDSDQRISAAIQYVLNQNASGGNCAMKATDLVSEVSKLINIDKAKARDCLLERTDGSPYGVVLVTVDGEDLVYLKNLHEAEIKTAALLIDLLDGPLPWVNRQPVNSVVETTETGIGLTLGDSQKEALVSALGNKVSVITGGPGVGKTTILRAYLYGLNSIAPKLKIGLAAPTGRAAKRMSESTGREALTIHRLLEYSAFSGGFARNAENPLELDIIVLDESSMLDIRLMAALLEAIPPHAVLLLVGDVDQLPSVGPGRVLRDIINSQTIPTVRLNQIFRQAESSKITTNAHLINQGMMPVATPQGITTDFYMFPYADTDSIQKSIVKMVSEAIPKKFGFDPVDDIQVLVPMHKGELGTQRLNSILQEKLNPAAVHGPKIEKFGIIYAVGDKVMQVSNNYEKDVFNGDVGRIVDLGSEDKRVVRISFDNKLVDYDVQDLDQVVLAYAITIHKSQGSEYPVVVMPLSNDHHVMLEKNLVYTGVTRGKQLVVMPHQNKALKKAVSTVKSHQRLTLLSERLQSEHMERFEENRTLNSLANNKKHKNDSSCFRP